MRLLVIVTGTCACALALASGAAAQAPVLSSVAQQQRHPSIAFSAPRASAVSVYFATKPDRNPDGSFVQQNLRESGILSAADIQAGTWNDPNEVDPGTYYVILRAQANFDACYDGSGLDPSCADGYSNVLTLVVPKPPVKYVARVKADRRGGTAQLVLRATPMGEKTPYRVCYRTLKKARRCASGSLEGYSWDRAVENVVYVRTDNLAPTTTFTWYVRGKKVASKSARVH
jgi:hypothetical protein